MTHEQYQDMAEELLNISFDILEWDEDFRNEQIEEVAKQIETLPQAIGILDTNIYLHDLLIEAYKRCFFEEG